MLLRWHCSVPCSGWPRSYLHLSAASLPASHSPGPAKQVFLPYQQEVSSQIPAQALSSTASRDISDDPAAEPISVAKELSAY